MPLQMTYSKGVPAFAASFEGYSAIATHHPEDPEDVWTLGFGSTYWRSGPGVTAQTQRVVQGMSCTRDEALLQLTYGLDTAEGCINTTVHVPLTQGEFDGCTDLTYNIGCSRWINSTARTRLNNGDYHGAASAFEMWDRAGGHEMAGLLRRRKAEEALFGS